MTRFHVRKLLARTALSAGLIASIAGCGGVAARVDHSDPSPVVFSAGFVEAGASARAPELAPEATPVITPQPVVANGKGCYYDARLFRSTVEAQQRPERAGLLAYA